MVSAEVCSGERGPFTGILALIHSISAQFELAIGRPELVSAYCEDLRKHLSGLSEAHGS